MLKKILIVDDDTLTIRLLSSRLQDAGYEVMTAEDGHSALDQAQRDQPDAVVMDIMLPDMQGSDVVKLLQENPDTANVQVVFLSGLIAQEDVDAEMIQVGGKYYPAISKPVDFNQLLALLQKTPR